MSSTNKTTNLELSQFIGSDSPKWLTDYNADMEKIDAGYQTVKAQADATDLIVGGQTSSISSLQSTVAEQGTAITGLRTDVTANSGSINTINSLIGNGEPTTTDKTIIGAINELAAEITPGVAASITYDNSNSGLAATNVQTAIDEVSASISDSYVFTGIHTINYTPESSELVEDAIAGIMNDLNTYLAANTDVYAMLRNCTVNGVALNLPTSHQLLHNSASNITSAGIAYSSNALHIRNGNLDTTAANCTLHVVDITPASVVDTSYTGNSTVASGTYSIVLLTYKKID